MIRTVAEWLLRAAAGRWPAESRDGLLREWYAEIDTIDREPEFRHRRMLAFSVSLAVSRPHREPLPFGWGRGATVACAVVLYLMLLAVAKTVWLKHFSYQEFGDPASAAAERLVVGAVALVPALCTAALGWVLGRRRPPVDAAPLGGILLAVVAACVGAGFLLEATGYATELVWRYSTPAPSTMQYQFGRQPYGMITSWVVWLAAFALLAGAVRRFRGWWRVPVGAGLAALVTAIAVTASTLVQFEAGTAPRGEMWKWFAQWMVPRAFGPPVHDEGAHSFASARMTIGFLDSYPHVLLALAAFGVAYLAASGVATSRRATPDDLSPGSSSS
ncbi:hypothetical protein Val02_01510 [Virgisporangium aliadipatigenens]|uniref:Uncharacterized protein n=1 Tax=Virgisporangium aliadipatigenens TaxID=741659 RepID=A0A8J3YFS5_9ACTN|nr:hypothetical protein [Virgisporangium aliadipatigenens]GIJ43265.1 hypothetical protein Val02_01510 [Virgisporangium aliadipatigenens]